MYLVLLSPPIASRLPVLLARRVGLALGLPTHPAHLFAHRPGVHFHCDLNFDPFAFMHENNKTYGLPRSFAIHLSWALNSIQGSPLRCTNFNVRSSRCGQQYPVRHPTHCLLTTCPRAHTRSVTDFVIKYPEYVAENHALSFLSDNNGNTYSLCHCTSPTHFF